MASKPNSVGKNMAGALKGDIQGSISKNYQGKPKNAIPNYPHNSTNSQSVDKWTQNHMQKRRKEETEKKQ